MHGGKSTGPKDQTENSNAVKHGFYSAALMDEEEKQLYAAAKTADLEDEIRIAKVKLFRFVKRASNPDLERTVQTTLALADISTQPTGESLDDKDFRDKPELTANERRLIRILAPNYADLVIRQLEVVRRLVLAHHQMQLAGGDGDNSAIGAFETMPYDEDPV